MKDREILRARARELARPRTRQTAAGETEEYLLFTAGERRYGITSAQFRSVQSIRSLTPLPGVPSFIRGIFDARGYIWSLVDLGRLLDVPATPASNDGIALLLEEGEMGFALAADTVEGLTAIAVASICSAGAGWGASSGKYIRGLAPDGLVLLDGKRLLSDPALVVG